MSKTHNLTLTTLTDLASAMLKLGRFAEAESRYREVIARRRSTGQHRRLNSAIAHSNLGVCLESQDRLEEAAEKFGEALTLLAACRIPERHWVTAGTRKGLAIVRAKQEKFPEAETTLLDCITIFANAEGDHTARIRKAREALVDVYDAWGKPEQARQLRELLAQH